MLRIIVAAALAISVAVLPAAGDAVFCSDHVAMSAAADMPCCPGCDSPDDGHGAACAAQCIGFFGAVMPPPVVLEHPSDGFVPPETGFALTAYLSRPPTHPPPA